MTDCDLRRTHETTELVFSWHSQVQQGGQACSTCHLLIGRGWMFCLPLSDSHVLSPLLSLIPLLPNLFTPLALLLPVSPAGTECHLLVSSLLGAHLGNWTVQHKEVLPWCLQFRKCWRAIQYVCDLWYETFSAFFTLCFALPLSYLFLLLHIHEVECSLISVHI